MKDIDQLISTLSRDAAPRRAPRGPVFLFATWFLGSCAYVVCLLLFACHPRPDLAEKLMQPLFGDETIALIILAAVSSLSATLLSFPDCYQKRWAAYAPLLAFAGFVGIVFIEWLHNPPAPPPEHHMECLLSISLMSLAPAAWIFIRIRRMAPVHPMLAGYTALLASFSIGALALRFSEPTDSMDHLIGWHYLPMIGVTMIGLWLGQKIFKW